MFLLNVRKTLADLNFILSLFIVAFEAFVTRIAFKPLS